jgi:hypothetical protein
LFDGCFDRIADGVTTIDRKVTGMSSVLWQMTIRFIGSVSRQLGEFGDVVRSP